MNRKSRWELAPSKDGHWTDPLIDRVGRYGQPESERLVQGLEETIGELARSIPDLARRAVTAYSPAVDSIVRARSEDVDQIEHTLDGLLDFCFDQEALLLYKQLCRHYHDIDPVATAEYVHAYRQMWDSDREVSP